MTRVFPYFLVLFGIIEASSHCYFGNLVNGTCQCYDGFDGDLCQDCRGRFRLTDMVGTISNGPDYAHFSDCMAVIEPNISSPYNIHLLFTYTGASCQGDFLKVYDGGSLQHPIIANFNGDVLPSQPPVALASSGTVTLNFYNEGGILHEGGYEISYSVEEADDTDEASGNYAGDSEEICCGQWCRYAWTNITNQGRASTGVAILGDHLYVFGGNLWGLPEAWVNFMRINVTSWDNEWEVIASSGVNLSTPEIRHGHSMVAHNNTLVVFGGAFTNNTITSELWLYDVMKERWTLLEQKTTFENQSLSLIGHSSHVTTNSGGNDVMLVFFGYHPQWRVSPFLFQFDFATREWDRVITTGALPVATYGHASVLDTTRNLIYVNGGLNDKARNHLYVFNVDGSHWTILPSSPSARYLHSMALLSGSLFVFGGKENEDFENHEECPNIASYMYNTECREWVKAEDVWIIASPRFGHFALTRDDRTMVIFGGYDGTMKSDVIGYRLNNSSICDITNQSVCSNTSYCQWSGTGCVSKCKQSEREMCSMLCESMTYHCDDCLATACSCCYGNESSQCVYEDTEDCAGKRTCDSDTSRSQFCKSMTTCGACYLGGCDWNEFDSVCEVKTDNTSSWHCPESCSSLMSCDQCAKMPGCSWCKTTGTCLPVESISIFYPYGDCLEYASTEERCTDDPCMTYESCDECFKDHHCGWCDHGSVTGYGTCMSGGRYGPLNGSCLSEQWNFIECPACQCNGHSTCGPQAPHICTSCDVGTTGPDCGSCDVMYFGDARNGRNCSECECHGHASSCSNKEGICHCEVRGTTGDHCESCLVESGFYGDAANDSCFYTMVVMTRYTFPLLDDNTRVTAINFDCCPQLKEDIKFNMELQSGMPYNLTITTNSTDGNETLVLIETNVSDIAFTMAQSQYGFGKSNQRCIRVYVTNLVAPTTISIWLVQNNLSIGEIILIFLTILLVLVGVAAISWKGMDLIRNYRRRRVRQEEVERMAARPMSAVLLDVDDDDDGDLGRDIITSPMNTHVIAEEICRSHVAAVSTALLWLPGRYQHDRTGLMLGTFLVTRQEQMELKLPQDDEVKKNTKLWSRFIARVTRAWQPRTVERGIENPNFLMEVDG